MAGKNEANGLTKKQRRLGTVVVLVLFAITVVSVLVAWTRYRPAVPIEISLPTNPVFQGNVEISGAVTSPGIYPFNGDDSIGSLIQSAGGTAPDASPARIEIRIPGASNQPSPQKININTAEVWLLEALPGIGEAKAESIVAYRESHGPFKLISDLMKVSGIGTSLFEQIEDLVTVTD